MSERKYKNGIMFWEEKMCRYCISEDCRKTAQAMAGLMVGQGAKKDYQSCIAGVKMAYLMGDRGFYKRFKAQGKPQIVEQK